MSRDESDREDLLREATALVERVELQVPGVAEPVVVGFRRDGAASFFFGADPVYQFNSAGEFRRAYVAGLLIKAEKGRLVSLRRERTESLTALVSRELDGDASAALLTAASDQLNRLRDALGRGDCEVLRQVPEDGDVSRRIRKWLAELPAALRIANQPGVR